MALAHPFFLVLLLLPFSSPAASAYNRLVRQAHEETVKLRLNQGALLIQQELQMNPSNAVAILIANQQDFLSWAVQQDPDDFDANLQRQEKRLQQLNALKERSPWVGYSQAEVKLHIALTKLLNNQKIAAAWELRQAYLQYVANTKQHPGFLPNRKTLGAMQVLIGSIPDSYRFFLNIIGMRGDVTLGMANLKAATGQTNPFREEAVLLLALLQHLVDQDPDSRAAKTVQKMAADAPDNLLYTFVAMHILKKTKQCEAALELYRRKPSGAAYLSFPYLQHMAADLYLYRGDYDRSIRENTLFLERHRSPHYVKAAHFKLYLAHLLNNQPARASHHLKRIPEVGREAVEEDTYAARFAHEEQSPNPYLLQARLRSDGGYNREALQVLSQMRINGQTPVAERAEYYYRKARIYHGLEELEPAKQHYKKTITECEQTTLYFAPYAALQLGYIYQQERRVDTARNWFRKALSYKGHDYKNSIDGKAKLALQTL